MNETNKALILAQEKLRVIDKLSNCIQKLNKSEILEVAYFMHSIIEKNDLSLDDYRMITSFSLQANKDLFINA